jgi:WD40 repeat protein
MIDLKIFINIILFMTNFFVISKWKASKTAITSISTDFTSKYLISSSKTITIWDLNSKSKLKTLTGHSNDIFTLEFLNNSPSTTHYFISAARNDRILNAWKFDEKNQTNDSSTALSAFNINEGAVYLDILNVSNNNALILAITNKGHLYVYLHQLESNTNNNSKLKKPIKAVNQLKLETNESNPIHILGTFVTNKQNERLDRIELEKKTIDYSNLKLAELLGQYFVCIIYGSQLNPKIEKMVYVYYFFYE